MNEALLLDIRVRFLHLVALLVLKTLRSITKSLDTYKCMI